MTAQVLDNHVVICTQFEKFVNERCHIEDKKNKAERDAWEMPERVILYTQGGTTPAKAVNIIYFLHSQSFFQYNVPYQA